MSQSEILTSFVCVETPIIILSSGVYKYITLLDISPDDLESFSSYRSISVELGGGAKLVLNVCPLHMLWLAMKSEGLLFI